MDKSKRLQMNTSISTSKAGVQHQFATIPADESVLNKCALLNFNNKFKLTKQGLPVRQQALLTLAEMRRNLY